MYMDMYWAPEPRHLFVSLLWQLHFINVGVKDYQEPTWGNVASLTLKHRTTVPSAARDMRWHIALPPPVA